MLEGFTWFRQSAYLWKGDGLTVAIDPWNVVSDTPADLILITHAHPITSSRRRSRSCRARDEGRRAALVRRGRARRGDARRAR